MKKIFKLNLMLLIFLFNCQEKKDLECSMYNQKVSFYMDKLTRLKQSAFFEEKKSKIYYKIKSDLSQTQDSTYYYYKKLIECDSTNINVVNDFRSFLFLNNKRLECLKYSNQCLKNDLINKYEKDQILQEKFYIMITEDSIKYKNQILDYYLYSKNIMIDKKKLKENNIDYENIIRNKIVAVYYFEGYDSAIKLLKENNYNYKLTDLWQTIELNHPLDVYRRMYDFDKPTFRPTRDISQSKNYKSLYENLKEYVKLKNNK